MSRGSHGINITWSRFKYLWSLEQFRLTYDGISDLNQKHFFSCKTSILFVHLNSQGPTLCSFANFKRTQNPKKGIHHYSYTSSIKISSSFWYTFFQAQHKPKLFAGKLHQLLIQSMKLATCCLTLTKRFCLNLVLQSETRKRF